MDISSAQLDALIESIEDENLEIKEAKAQYSYEKLVKYCATLANERGGKMIFGVTNEKPRKVVGTNAFRNLNEIKSKLVNRLKIYVEACIVDHPNGRVLVFDVPSRPIGRPIPYDGGYFMRVGEELVEMTADRLGKIFAEAGPDFSAEICPKAKLSDLDPRAIDYMRAMWKLKSGNEGLDTLETEQLLADLDLVIDGKVTYAALILLGTEQALRRYLRQSEVVFEYRANEASISYQQRKEFRQGFFLFVEELWQIIDARNEVYHYEDGLFVGDIPTFDDRVVREALLNAVSHRDYCVANPTFVRQFSHKLEIRSPGGFAPGVTAENILWKQFSRNRLIAEVFQKCGLVERSGQGARLMFQRSIRESKLRPDFSRTDQHEVYLTLHGEVRDPRFLHFFMKVGKETLASFTTQDFLVVDLIHQEQPIPPELQRHLPRLLGLGVIESQGRGVNKRHFLSRRFYGSLGKKGTYTRKRGLDRQTNKQLLLRHIEDNEEDGTRFEELAQVLPELSRDSIQGLMKELKKEERIHNIGRTNAARWYPGPPKEEKLALQTQLDVVERN